MIDYLYGAGLILAGLWAMLDQIPIGDTGVSLREFGVGVLLTGWIIWLVQRVVFRETDDGGASK